MFCRRTFLLLNLFGFVALTITGCGLANFNNRFSAEETEFKSFATKGTPRVMADSFNGAIEVTTGALDTVNASVTKHATGSSQDAADDDLDTIEVSMTQEAEAIRIKAFVKEKKLFSNRSARITLQVPPGAILELHTSNGKVSATGETGAITAESSNGDMEVRGSRGKLHLKTSNGAITVEGGSDRLEVQTSNGKIAIKAEDVVVDAHTSNGAINFKGSLAEGEHVFRTANGKIALTLPEHAQFRVDGETSNGKIVSDFQVKQTQEKRRTQLHGTVGDNPATTIKLHTSNGGIEIHQEK